MASDDDFVDIIRGILLLIIYLFILIYIIWAFLNTEPIKSYVNNLIQQLVSFLILAGKVTLIILLGIGVAYVIWRYLFEGSTSTSGEDEEDLMIDKEIEKTLYSIINAIKEFEPPRNYDNERGYHDTLFVWLKSRFPDTEMEYQIGASRPDIVIEIENTSVAIEVKGPTGSQELQTIADKLLRYKRYFDYIIIVLFDVRVSFARYEEWVAGIEETFSNVYIIRQE